MEENNMINLSKLKHNKVISNVIVENEEHILNLKRDIDPKEFMNHMSDEPTFSYIQDYEFRNGIIEVKVLSKFLNDAPEFSRGFIGVAFRINSDLSQYESIYIRPDNGSCDDQVRRNHSTQYYSYPDYKWFTLRENEPKKYESYADIAMNEWIQLKIVVKDSRAELYINNAKSPNLIVTDLKNGSDLKGTVGLWTEIGTDAYFKDFKITKD